MVPKYKELLLGNWHGIKAIKETPIAEDEEFRNVVEKLLRDSMSHPDEATLVHGEGSTAFIS